MGMTRKTMSMFTMGLVDFRSDKERTAAYTRGIRHQARKQTKILKDSGQTATPATGERERYPTWAETKAAWKAAGEAGWKAGGGK